MEADRGQILNVPHNPFVLVRIQYRSDQHIADLPLDLLFVTHLLTDQSPDLYTLGLM